MKSIKVVRFTEAVNFEDEFFFQLELNQELETGVSIRAIMVSEGAVWVYLTQGTNYAFPLHQVTQMEF